MKTYVVTKLSIIDYDTPILLICEVFNDIHKAHLYMISSYESSINKKHQFFELKTTKQKIDYIKRLKGAFSLKITEKEVL